MIGWIFLFPLAFVLYCVLASRDALRAWRAERAQGPLARQRHIAQMEADLGMLPATEGACASCGKPLQVGAEFCAYCGAATKPRARVCPKCATSALPDAAYCPKCETAP